MTTDYSKLIFIGLEVMKYKKDGNESVAYWQHVAFRLDTIYQIEEGTGGQSSLTVIFPKSSSLQVKTCRQTHQEVQDRIKAAVDHFASILREGL